MPTRPALIQWHQPDSDQVDRMMADRAKRFAVATAERALPEAAPPLDPIIQTMMRVGIPLVEGVKTSKEQAIHLLKFAAEVEHALMAQYLYTYVSVVNSDTGKTDHARELLNVAIQEMGHLATVQNILLLVGGRD